MYVLDTNTLIYFFKGIGNVSEKILSISPQDFSIPTIVLLELEVGIAKSSAPEKKRKQLNVFTSAVRIIPFDIEEIAYSAAIRAELEIIGTPIGPYDALIAGTTMANNGILVTHNTKEFERVKGLQIEDWY